jgi:hypothetical protein
MDTSGQNISPWTAKVVVINGETYICEGRSEEEIAEVEADLMRELASQQPPKET